jgi:hypothetical protein
LLYVVVGLAIHESYVILGAHTSGPEVEKEITGGEAGVAHRVANNEQRIRVRDFNAAAKVERAASVDRTASCGACIHFCRYSADTLHPSPKIIRQKRPLRSVHETVHK